MPLTNKQIVLGITGGIAAYKSADLVRRLREQGAAVRVVMTSAAQQFITPLTLQALSGHAVHTDLLDPRAEAAMGHIELARWADIVVVAPASADFMAQLAHGHAKDLLSTLCLATVAKIVLAPAMNQQMWQDPATQANITLLQHHTILNPAEGAQACGDIGPGRMQEPVAITAAIDNLFQSEKLSGVKVLLTLGPTREPIDPVRYLSNRSSGKMGLALAQALLDAGAKVTQVCGPIHLPVSERARNIEVESAQQMYDAVMAEVPNCDIFISCAAVADYRVATPATQKIAKTQAELQLTLARNPDIVASVAKLPKRPFIVGFAAQTHDVNTTAKTKLVQKKLDMIVANQVGGATGGFASDQNACTVLWHDGQQAFPLMTKVTLADKLINLIAERFLLQRN